MKLVVTGAGGFIGRAVCRLAQRRGLSVVALARSREAESWALGEALPIAATDADCIIHLACATIGTSADVTRAAELDLMGTRRLIDDIARQDTQSVPTRFIFVSSQSASPQARNAYGRSKWAIEQFVASAGQMIVRPGLVYGEQPTGVAGLFAALSAMPIVPKVDTPAAIQPIHVEELAECLLRIAVHDAPASRHQLGSVRGLTFRDAVEASARRRRRRPPVFLPVPVGAVRWSARALDGLKRGGPRLVERIEGLLALEPMETASSLERLEMSLSSFDRPS